MRLHFRHCSVLLLAMLVAVSRPAVAQQESQPVQIESAKPDEARSTPAESQTTTPPARTEERETTSQQQPLPDQTDRPIEQLPSATQQTEAAPSQDEKKPDPEATAAKSAPAADKTVPRAPRIPPLPADSTTTHTLAAAGRTLEFEAVAGSIPLANAEGRVQAHIAYVSYTAAGADAKSRPVAFAFNGGPGSASAWLHLGTLGPWRLLMDGDAARRFPMPRRGSISPISCSSIRLEQATAASRACPPLRPAPPHGETANAARRANPMSRSSTGPSTVTWLRSRASFPNG